ncbi:MAG: hypothetical protein AAF492_17750 [Verrucomicrobiota bacterium]
MEEPELQLPLELLVERFIKTFDRTDFIPPLDEFDITAGLRPLTEFEFTKATRGSGTPIAHEFPWGTNNKYKLKRMLNEHGEFFMFNGWDESDLNDNTKEVFGASYYWVMDLAGGLWERVITVGHDKGRSFLGTHGDGEISSGQQM